MKTVDLPAGPIAYGDTGGDGPVLVFGHGLLMDGRQWRKVIPLLAEYRCITPTLPLGAHVAPMRADADLTETGVAHILADFLDALNLSGVTLVLNDWGGGQFIISEGRDARIAKLVLASCTAFDNYPPKPARPASLLCRLPGGGWVLTRMLNTAFFRRSTRAYGALSKTRIPDELFDDWFQPARENPYVRRDLVKFAVGAPPRGRLLEMSSRMSSFDRPVLVIWASDDQMMPLAHADRLVDLYPQASKQIVDDSWTLIPEDQPRVMADALRAFVG
ncbi:alpha/beta hydrolase [Mycolicibacterium conceptionense]|uniref:Alpha/beta hydrolase n=1 Tax=Mycolicibacterium conceptionense TaxID=451644 RepID=A0A1A2UWJ8_9MYCO|nr:MULTISPECIES: alpha/beta hydrolase [Mycolicibacterium]MCW1820840.1 alpha/beta hydrolase [Mycolicibacterium senegalense]OBB14197.1 alpha/beta hydrolase [Mycolicibacterium conceptionense]OBF07241.1 alpha/beta hydrolase [Mycolicibacterium conceptionense]OBF28120.1 alpha/beta hydrolase [Mycolicibacterium conceptionense]OBF38643.1 alpha/beta hydrolase [Mycolicibacterium conceptionense]